MRALRRNRDPALHSINDLERSLARRKAALALSLLILTGCTSSTSSSAADTNTSAPSSSSTGNTMPSKPNSPTAQQSGVYTEIAEWSAPIFDKLTFGAIKIGKTVAGHSYTVICRIPPRTDQPQTVRKGGWYAVPDKDGINNTAWVAANTFENGPMPNDNPYDSNVAVCTPQQEEQAWHSNPGRAINLITTALKAGRSQFSEQLVT